MARRVLAWAAMCDGVERVAMEINNTETTPSRSDIMALSPLQRIKWRMDCTAIRSSHHRPITRLCISCKTFKRSRSRPFNVLTSCAIRRLCLQETGHLQFAQIGHSHIAAAGPPASSPASVLPSTRRRGCRCSLRGTWRCARRELKDQTIELNRPELRSGPKVNQKRLGHAA